MPATATWLAVVLVVTRSNALIVAAATRVTREPSVNARFDMGRTLQFFVGRVRKSTRAAGGRGRAPDSGWGENGGRWPSGPLDSEVRGPPGLLVIPDRLGAEVGVLLVDAVDRLVQLAAGGLHLGV